VILSPESRWSEVGTSHIPHPSKSRLINLILPHRKVISPRTSPNLYVFLLVLPRLSFRNHLSYRTIYPPLRVVYCSFPCLLRPTFILSNLYNVQARLGLPF
jgi:hypothetical protein